MADAQDKVDAEAKEKIALPKSETVVMSDKLPEKEIPKDAVKSALVSETDKLRQQEEALRVELIEMKEQQKLEHQKLKTDRISAKLALEQEKIRRDQDKAAEKQHLADEKKQKKKRHLIEVDITQSISGTRDNVKNLPVNETRSSLPAPDYQGVVGNIIKSASVKSTEIVPKKETVAYNGTVPAPAHLPIAQIPLSSALGKALGQVNQLQHDGGGPPSDDSSSSSDSEDSSSSLDDSSDANSSDSEEDRNRKKRKSKKKRTHRKKGTKTERIKPIEPTTYNGSAETTAISRFIREAVDYVTTGRVVPSRQVRVVSKYLKGKAYRFYEQQVAINDGQWTLDQFFTELFNHCFPPNF